MTPKQENKNPEKISHIRHSLAHLLAMAALEHDPSAKLTLGPAIENGFYYDIAFSDGKMPTQDDLKKFEKKMKKLISGKLAFSGREVSAGEAREIFAGNEYKQELIDEIEKRQQEQEREREGQKNGEGEKITVYKTGEEFCDLCRGGHIENTGEINPDAFALTHIAGAYWRGNEKNTMLTRVYGLAFETPEELLEYQKLQEEAKKRDHRKLGRELDLFTISELVGSGLPLFTPKGAVLRETLAAYSQELQAKYGFERVWTPHMARTELYKYSGHYDKYPERFEVTSSESDDVFMLKPMNCPHHAQLFARKQWSYRELPVRYMENTTNYRDEKHGELHGLSRVRSLSQDDGHIFCREEDMKEELRSVVKMVKELYARLGMDFLARLSYRDDSDKFLGDDAVWEKAENAIAEVAKEENLEAADGVGEAAFYGPKIDFLVKDSLGREWQCATVQLDFVQPERFGLSYIASDGTSKRPVMIHKALLGSIERFISVYIEHTGGAFPFWLAPVQAAVLPVSEKHNEYAKKVFNELREKNMRAELHDHNESLGKKIRNAKMQKIPYLLIVGDKEVESNTVTIESRDEGNLGAKSVEDFAKSAIAMLLL